MSPSASPIKKKPKPLTRGDMADKMANTVAHFEDILRTELTAMRNEFASHMSVVQSLCSKLNLLTGEMREQKKLSQITIAVNHSTGMDKHQIAISSSSERDKGNLLTDTPCSESQPARIKDPLHLLQVLICVFQILGPLLVLKEISIPQSFVFKAFETDSGSFPLLHCYPAQPVENVATIGLLI
ncbi:hypothetical protein DPX16_22313 [Anabarilius grahami]|uniref:Uncharacterized protein n=1 Tax=Anabarilius grahami TaxID=495550 RepID=A0A3N0Y7H2_ANAGA|nr:hypothetical protein DPX16_22313 [Anabarilius grahami]